MDFDLEVRLAELSDSDRILQWNNDPETRKNSINQDEISKEDHAKWYAGKLEDPEYLMLVLEKDQTPCGLVRYDLDEHLISIVLSPEFRGQGLGKHVLAIGVGFIEGAGHSLIRADVEEPNVSSHKIFEQCGFEKIGERTLDGRLFYQYIRRS